MYFISVRRMATSKPGRFIVAVAARTEIIIEFSMEVDNETGVLAIVWSQIRELPRERRFDSQSD